MQLYRNFKKLWVSQTPCRVSDKSRECRLQPEPWMPQMSNDIMSDVFNSILTLNSLFEVINTFFCNIINIWYLCDEMGTGNFDGYKNRFCSLINLVDIKMGVKKLIKINERFSIFRLLTGTKWLIRQHLWYLIFKMSTLINLNS